MIARPQAEQVREREARRVAARPRAFALGLALMTLNIFWITVIEVRWYTLDITNLPIFITPIFMLFVSVWGGGRVSGLQVLAGTRVVQSAQQLVDRRAVAPS